MCTRQVVQLTLNSFTVTGNVAEKSIICLFLGSEPMMASIVAAALKEKKKGKEKKGALMESQDAFVGQSWASPTHFQLTHKFVAKELIGFVKDKDVAIVHLRNILLNQVEDTARRCHHNMNCVH